MSGKRVMKTEVHRISLIRWTLTAWIDRETAMSLAVGAAMGLLLCIVVLPASVRMLLTTHHFDLSQVSLPRDNQTPRLPPIVRPNDVPIGDDKPNVVRVAWISHNDYRRLIAPRGPTEQPAIQMTVDPVPAAPHRLDATTPGAAARRSRTTTAEARQQRLHPALPTRPNGTLVPNRPKGTHQHAKMKTTQATEAAPRKLTASARTDREASAVSLIGDSSKVQAGRVITAEGVRIQTVAPRINAVTYLTAMRGGIRLPVHVKFDLEGRVIKAQLCKRTGYPEVDTPILASLYRWKAGGEHLADMDGPFEIPILLEIGVK